MVAILIRVSTFVWFLHNVPLGPPMCTQIKKASYNSSKQNRNKHRQEANILNKHIYIYIINNMLYIILY